MDVVWKELDHDPISGCKIYAADGSADPKNPLSRFNATVEEQFEVRNAKEEVLLRAFGSANGEHWAGVFLFFVEGSDGKRVRLDQSDKDDIFYDVPNEPSDPPAILQHWA